MYRISELATKVSMSRTALLYYEKLGLIEGRRADNGYRIYSETDVQRIKLIQQLHQGGLSLMECKMTLDSKLDRDLLANRLVKLDEEIASKQQSRHLLASLLSNEKPWHEMAIKNAPSAYMQWLNAQGFNAQEAIQIKWLSKTMTHHDQYMNDFNLIFDELLRWGPGSHNDTLKALSKVPNTPRTVLDIGCGKGASTCILAQNLDASITAIDTNKSALTFLSNEVMSLSKTATVYTICGSMEQLPFHNKTFDLIWSEGAAYIMGVEQALKSWKALLTANGVLVFSDLVFNTQSVSEEVATYWEQAYPDMQTLDTRRSQVSEAGYELVADFSLGGSAWNNYYQPLQQRINTLLPEMANSDAVKCLIDEINFYNAHHEAYDYHMFIVVNTKRR